MSRFAYVMTTYFSVLIITGLSFLPIAPKLIWNASASTPIGLYRITRVDIFAVGDLVAVDPPEPFANLLVTRGYVARGAPLMKLVAAGPGQEVCRSGREITIDGWPVAAALDRDRMGRQLPVWRGCHLLAIREVFLLNANVPDSLDGRYFGPLPTASIIDRAQPLYTDDDGDGRFEWRSRSPRAAPADPSPSVPTR